MSEPNSDILLRLRGVQHNILADMTREAADEIERLRAELSKKVGELADAIKERDEALDERSYWYREHSRLIEKLVSLEREDNERKRLDAIERIDAMIRWMNQVTMMLYHSITHSHDAKQELAARCDNAIAAMRKGGGE